MATALELTPTGPRPLAVAPFEDWTYDDVVREMRDNMDAEYGIRKDYAIDHDHFRRGAEWVGPGMAGSDRKIQTQFAPEDAVGAVLSNVSNAFSEPQLGAAPLGAYTEGQKIPEQIENRINEAVSLLSRWWDNQKLQEHIQNRQWTGAWAARAALRLWIPWRFLESDGETITFRRGVKIEEALSFIHVNAPLPEAGAVLVDPGTQDHCAVFMDEEVYVDARGDRQTVKRAELTYLAPERLRDEDAETVMRIVYSDKRPEKRVTMKLGGRLMMAEMHVQTLLTDPVLRTQRQLNLLTTLITRIAETAAFRERYIMNAKPQGMRVPYVDGDTIPNGAFLERDDEGRLWAVIPQERTLGAKTTTELVGLPQADNAGDTKGFHQPSIEVVDPVDPKPYLDAIDATRRRVLRMCGQGHLGGVSNAEASGIAYEQARAVFEKDLNKRRVAEEGMLRELLTAALALAELIANRPGYFTGLMRLTIDQHIDPGPRSPDLVRLDLEAYQQSILSRETTMARFGVEDVTAEVVRVRMSPQDILALLNELPALVEMFEPESLVEMLEVLNIPQEIINVLKIKEKEEVPPPLSSPNTMTMPPPPQV
jgi:hypothetical protein